LLKPIEQSIGIIETNGLLVAIEAADAMVKTAQVSLYFRRQLGAGLTVVLCVGELADCQVAVQAGAYAARRVGKLCAHHVIARPGADLDVWLEQTAVEVRL